MSGALEDSSLTLLKLVSLMTFRILEWFRLFFTRDKAGNKDVDYTSQRKGNRSHQSIFC